jgi:hypothetical protein
MTRAQIELRIRIVECELSKAKDVSTIATLNRCLEKLIMMEASDES